MEYYRAPLQDQMFALRTFKYQERVASLEKYQDYDIETMQALLESSADVLTKETMPLNKIGDKEGVKWDPETYEVTTATGFKEAYQTLVDNGMMSITGPLEYGGGGAPETFGSLISEIATATNKSFTMCSGLTRGLIEALVAHATEEQKQEYLPKLITGEWSGTMCLTEPQCGTDLGLITTKAEPQEDGSYKLTGTKIWITFGEHDMTSNIIHLVLARLPDAPEGIKGISTFVVPKFIDGERNQVYCSGLEHKMGIHASPTCVIELEGATGYLFGEPNKGMRSMFTMMNVARLHVGFEGIALSEISYQTALAFAKDRKQSRALDPSKSDPNAPADNILVHADVRRMLLNIKATNEGMRALATFVSIEHDVSVHHPDEKVREEAEDMVALLTPIVKAFFSERGFLNISEAMQVCGGAGYTADWNIEQYLRDERIAMIYEGTNHIQGLDLVGRKLPMHGGRLMQNFANRVTTLIRENKEDENMAPFIGPLKNASKVLTGVTMELAGQAMEDREVAGAVATNYLRLFGLVAIGFALTHQARYALDNPSPQSSTKLKTVKWYMDVILPEMDSLVKVIAASKSNMFEFDVEEF
jgi:alkylation response protein AidB-like acyl-CoA dehydrogenase